MKCSKKAGMQKDRRSKARSLIRKCLTFRPELWTCSDDCMDVACTLSIALLICCNIVYANEKGAKQYFLLKKNFFSDFDTTQNNSDLIKNSVFLQNLPGSN